MFLWSFLNGAVIIIIMDLFKSYHVIRRSNLDKLWAFGRQSCIEAMTKIALRVGVVRFPEPNALIDWWVSSVSKKEFFTASYL